MEAAAENLVSQMKGIQVDDSGENAPSLTGDDEALGLEELVNKDDHVAPASLSAADSSSDDNATSVTKPGSVDDTEVNGSATATAVNELYYLQVLGQYLQNVRTKENHSSFLKDAVVGPFLSLCLASNSDKVLVGVLKVINILVKNRDNLPRLRELLHFTDALLAASKNESIHGAIRQKASNFYDLISNSKQHLCNNPGTLNQAQYGDTRVPDCTKPLSSARKTQLLVNHALNKERRFVITRALVKIDGVISIAFNPDQHLCIVRSRNVRPEVLGVTVASLGFQCSLITRNENSEIIRVPMVAENKLEKKENQDLFYFPEEDDDEPICDNAIAVKGFADDDDGEGWWTSAKKLVRKSLFW